MRKLRFVTAATLMTAAATQAYASGTHIDIGIIPDQATFNALVDQLGSVIPYEPVAPSEPLGTTGFDVGVVVTSYKIDRELWNSVVRGDNAPSRLPVPRLIARKGLPFGVDVGASYSRVPSSNISVLGVGVSKALLDGSAMTPAVSVSGNYSRLSGVDDLRLSSYGVDLGISKGFAMLTPYAGIGQIWYEGREQSAAVDYSTRNASQFRSYLGVRVGLLPFMSVTAQADFAHIDSYSLRLNLGF
ncbi:MAG: hypothetical protein LBV36_00150 [Chromatiales bacterium]|jgi:hypothetical protein|nr:hypothetical protein [Chromatiales bacterium]